MRSVVLARWRSLARPRRRADAAHRRSMAAHLESIGDARPDKLSARRPRRSRSLRRLPRSTGGERDDDFLPDRQCRDISRQAGLGDYTVLNRVTPAEWAQSDPAQRRRSFRRSPAARDRRQYLVLQPQRDRRRRASAYFDVGGLLLTSLTPVLNSSPVPGSTTPTVSSPGSPATPAMAARSKILNGAQIKAIEQNSYIALVAPRIEQGGDVRVNGQPPMSRRTA